MFLLNHNHRLASHKLPKNRCGCFVSVISGLSVTLNHHSSLSPASLSERAIVFEMNLSFMSHALLDVHTADSHLPAAVQTQAAAQWTHTVYSSRWKMSVELKGDNFCLLAVTRVGELYVFRAQNKWAGCVIVQAKKVTASESHTQCEIGSRFWLMLLILSKSLLDWSLTPSQILRQVWWFVTVQSHPLSTTGSFLQIFSTPGC